MLNASLVISDPKSVGVLWHSPGPSSLGPCAQVLHRVSQILRPSELESFQVSLEAGLQVPLQTISVSGPRILWVWLWWRVPG